mgnify:CR=1 FL=1
MLRRFFQGFQQRIEGLGSQHVYLIDDVDLVASIDRRELDRLAQITDFIDAAIGGRIDLKDIHRGAVRDLTALLALPAGLRRRPMLACSAFARILAVLVLPVPRGPENR